MFDTKLYVVRHAQGMGNKLAEFHGQYNSDLTELGKKQAECTAEYLKEEDLYNTARWTYEIIKEAAK